MDHNWFTVYAIDAECQSNKLITLTTSLNFPFLLLVNVKETLYVSRYKIVTYSYLVDQGVDVIAKTLCFLLLKRMILELNMIKFERNELVTLSI